MTGVELLYYRSYRGTFGRPLSSVWPITRVALGMMFRRKLFWVLYGLGLFIFFMFFFGQYLFAWARAQEPQANVDVFFLSHSREQLIRFFQSRLKLDGSPATYANFFWYQGYMVMVVLALAGSILVGNDFRHGSLSFYLSKPLSRWHYLLGKCLAVAVFVNLMTTLPALLLFVQFGLLEEWSYFSYNLHLLFGILGYGLILTVCLSLLLVATASWVRQTVPLIMLWTLLFVFCRHLGFVLVDLLRYDTRWRLIDLWNDAYLVGCQLLGMRPGPRMPAYTEAAAVLAGVCLLCLVCWIRRIRAVEVVK